ncbi:hypothetical protein PAXINDRAFT_170916 [Paxillus involutus ATCC 200175]|uniref:Unplaced genomic scaffold PAXINscaffold_35, whole genome shotgun sequence n=1 Tax=Paxillus involutus ATCC 200175 TaxID=664439 RepID=A0A0C9U0F0_PAXIN|nr:hypothetical protein PAXINDRAFT_170916 [Paxillus involutus ATCC 200175]
MKKSVFNFIVDQWSTIPSVETADLSGKTVVVVGANVGIGFEAAKHLARMNPAKLIIACRSESKGKAALADIQTETGCQSCELWQVDLADFASVKSFAERFQRECQRLDILVMNAAILARSYEATVDGWESSIQVNHLSTALLSLLLLPHMISTGKKFGTTSRLVVVSSDVHYWAVIKDEVKESSNLLAKLGSKEYSTPEYMRARYYDTKLLNVFFARALQAHIQSTTPLTINAVNPGFCYSNLRRSFYEQPFTNMIMYVWEKVLAWTSEQGSRQLIYAAVAERDNEDHMKGAFVSHAEVVEPSDFVLSEEGMKMQGMFWKETVEILTKEAPQLKSILQEYLSG